MIVISRAHGFRFAAPYLMGCTDLAEGAVDWTILESTELPSDAHSDPPSNRVVARLNWDRLFYEVFEVDPSMFVFRVYGIADATIDLARREVVWSPIIGADKGRMQVLAAGTVAAIVCLLQGLLIIHASAVARDGRAVAIAGPSGAGKSTLAALTCLGGADIVTDDVLRVSVDDGAATCFPGSVALRLRKASPALPAGAQIVATSSDDRLLMAPKPTDLAQLPLDRIILPRRSATAPAMYLNRLSEHEAGLALLGSPRVFGWRHCRADEIFQQLMSLVQMVPVSELVVPVTDDLATLPTKDLLDLIFTG